MGNKITLGIRDNIATIKLMDPEKLNPLNKETGRELYETLENLKHNNEVRCLIITGSGRAFSAGGDIKQFKSSIENGTSSQVMEETLSNLYKIAKTLRLYPKPVIAAVNGDDNINEIRNSLEYFMEVSGITSDELSEHQIKRNNGNKN